ncbi:conserved hypothetical protein [Burkholderiales bacterium 8X]|nr:conserved hypothetical protein [Burkholderiales bacterium 8X]
MPANAKVIRSIEYRAGDGPMVEIPEGLLEVNLHDDSAVLSWDDGGSPQTAAIPLEEYERFVREGRIARD